MNKTLFLKQLRETADVLKPLTLHASSGSAIWDGRQYIKNGELRVPDPFALSWWSRLHTIADLIEAQESPLGPNQIAYLDRVLFGGMGSLQDLSFESSSLNKDLDNRRHALFVIFKD